jgi:hypothetical protein
MKQNPGSNFTENSAHPYNFTEIASSTVMLYTSARWYLAYHRIIPGPVRNQVSRADIGLQSSM